jgi:tRNA-Thr(GGU) m(6)t(6)A37 methyltransferase TsaA
VTPDSTSRWEVSPIGVVHSPFRSHDDIPRQPAFADDRAIGTVTVFAPYAAALADLEGFERIWLVCWLDRAREARMRVMPYLETRERGLFATRSPNRPNPIGISPVHLLRREDAVLHVGHLDLLDGTPVLDIKPYVPQIDAFPDSRRGWIRDREEPTTPPR